METHHGYGSGTGPGTTTYSGSSSTGAFHSEHNQPLSTQNRRPKPPSHFPHQNPNLINRSSFAQWDESEFPSPIESTGMKRTASYSSFLSKKPGPLYKPTLQHARALNGQNNIPDLYATVEDDSLPTTLTKTPTYEYYGFVLYLVSGITYDEHANPFHTMNSASSLTEDFVPDLMDIPIGMVNACLYQHIEGISDEEEGEEGEEEEYDDGSYFDESNPSDWEDSADM
ncbi:hypothetical protein BG011_005828 [Mortierella polycephala]|uniref:Uncharacterized protein n=1 Tax=Mortierella polycephala TaxID=41804 RepID=A0A9P6PXY0_9FUNG|nr:hypothetical protein BG011_005828 [Mortierella polycephala]